MDGSDVVAASAKGLASEALQAFHSHEKMDDIRFSGMDKKLDDLKSNMQDITKEMRKGFDRIDAKFWSLAIAIILLLISTCSALIWKFVIHG